MIVIPLIKFPLASFILISTFPVFKISIVGIPPSALLDSQVLIWRKPLNFFISHFLCSHFLSRISHFKVCYLAFFTLLCRTFHLAFSILSSLIFQFVMSHFLSRISHFLFCHLSFSSLLCCIFYLASRIFYFVV